MASSNNPHAPAPPVTDPRGKKRQSTRGRTLVLNASVFPGDVEMLDEIQVFLGSNRSDAIRACIRAYYGMLKK